MNYLAQACIIGRFQAQEWVYTQDERGPICLPCWKSLKFAKYIEIFGKQIHQGSVKLPSIYLLSSNLSEFSKKGVGCTQRLALNYSS